LVGAFPNLTPTEWTPWKFTGTYNTTGQSFWASFIKTVLISLEGHVITKGKFYQNQFFTLGKDAKANFWNDSNRYPY